MKQVITLLKPRIWSFKNPVIADRKEGRLVKPLLIGVVGFVFWAGMFAIAYRVLVYFKSIEDLGDLLALKLLSMVLITVFSLLIFSGILTALSKLYLSKDLCLIHSMPVSSYKIFLARSVESAVDSSWMVMVYTLPIFISYGIIYNTGPFFYGIVLASLLSLSIIASCISVFLVMLAVMIVPASRLRSLFIFLGICLFLFLYLAFRLLRPERLVDPEAFSTALVYLKALKTPSSPLLPSTWAFDSLKAALSGSIGTGIFHTVLSWSCAMAMIFANLIIADAAYFKGLSKAQTAPQKLFRRRISRARFSAFLPGPVRAFAVKEIKTFFRDQTQWSQLFLIGALIVIYIYNFKVLPLEKAPIKTVYLQNLLSFLNMGLASFVLIAITARFAYPAVGTEGEAFWLVKSSPITLRAFLWIKFFMYFLPLLVLSEIVIVATNLLLRVTPFMMILSTTTIFFLVPGVVSIGIGLGAAYPDFKSENPAQSVTSFGGFVFMILCAGFTGAVILLEADPVYSLFMADIRNRALTVLEWIWVTGAFTLSFILSIFAIVLPMRFGEKRLSEIFT